VAQAKVIDGGRRCQDPRRRRRSREAAPQREEPDPGLATVLVGNDPSSKVYVRGKGRACVGAGLLVRAQPAGQISEGALIAEVESSMAMTGSMGYSSSCRCRVPRSRRVIAAIDPAKDVDGLHPLNVARLGLALRSGAVHATRLPSPAAHGGITTSRVLRRWSWVDQICRKTVAALLLASDCTVTMVHSKSRDAACDLPARRYPCRRDRTAADGEGLIGSSPALP